jgi:hypothetical protein
MYRDLFSQHQGAHNYINQLFNLTVSCVWQKYRNFYNLQCICDVNNYNKKNKNNNKTPIYQIYPNK